MPEAPASRHSREYAASVSVIGSSVISSSFQCSRISFWTYFVEPVMRLITASGEKTVWMNGASSARPPR